MDKTIKGPLSGLRQLLSNDSPLKLMKNVFYFMLIAIFVLEIFTFLSWLFGYVKIGMMKKLRLISKFMTSQTGQQIIPIHIFPNISRGKSNQEIKFVQLIEHNMRNNFLQKSCRKWSSGTSAISLFFIYKVKPSAKHLRVNIFW